MGSPRSVHPSTAAIVPIMPASKAGAGHHASTRTCPEPIETTVGCTSKGDERTADMRLSIVCVPADISGVHSELIGDGSRSTLSQLGSSNDEVLLTAWAKSVEHEACTRRSR